MWQNSKLIWKDILEVVPVISELWVMMKQSLKAEGSWSLINAFATERRTWSVKWLWPLVLPLSAAACVGGWISSKRPRTLPDRAGISSGNGSHRHGWIKRKKTCLSSRRKLPESGHRGKLLAFSCDHLLLKQKRFFMCSCSQGKV